MTRGSLFLEFEEIRSEESLKFHFASQRANNDTRAGDKTWQNIRERGRAAEVNAKKVAKKTRSPVTNERTVRSKFKANERASVQWSSPPELGHCNPILSNNVDGNSE